MTLPIKNFFKTRLAIFLSMLFVLFGLSAYGQEKGDKTYIKVTEEGTTYELIGWETKVVYNPYMYTWFGWEDPIVKKEKVEMTEMVPVSEFDRPPVFSGECLTAEDRFTCSNDKLREYVEEQYVRYPRPAALQEQEGLEYVTFTIDENGHFEGNLKVVSKDKPCKGCAETAVDIVASMEDMWFPAVKDGKTVKTQLTIPVRFMLIDN